MHVRLIRNATLLVHIGAHRLLVDPMLDPAGARPPVEGTPSRRRNPLVELPEPAEVVVAGIDGVVLTHRHTDHFDATAQKLLPPDVPVLCQPEDAEVLRGQDRDARPVPDELEWDGVRVLRTGGRHGTGELGASLGPVSGFVLIAAGEPVLYIAGDTIWCPEVRAALDAHEPDLVVVNAGGARFDAGDPITMTTDDVIAVARRAPQARIVAVHLEAIAHCPETRADLHERVHAEGLHEQVTVPEDGAEVPVMAVGG
jgi:L-ascorbate metabolism protein UlaG (beta-lactamase superfamily)